MVYTNQLLVFTRLGNDDLVDIVPLKEIAQIKGIEEDREVDPFNMLTEERGDVIPDDGGCILEINTALDGYNSGRVFKIRVNSNKAKQDIINDLTRFSSIERAKLVVKSKYKKMQDKIAVIIDSNMVQMFLALLITMVRM